MCEIERDAIGFTGNFQPKTIVFIFPALLSGEAPTIFSVREKEAI